MGGQNFEEEASSLFWEIVGILKQIKQVFGFDFNVKYATENVASMDREAEQEISATLGVRPLRMDSADVVRIHRLRPRFCWTNISLEPMEGITLEEHQHWLDVKMEHHYPEVGQWLEPGAVWPGAEWGAIFTTSMKTIKRVRPPPKPAGLERSSKDAVLRWEADNFRFPPINTAINSLFGWKTDGVY